MRHGIFFVWLAGVAAAQSGSSQSPQVITLTGSQRSLTRDYLPPVTLPSILQGSTIATAALSLPSRNTGLSNATISRSTPTTSRTTKSEEPLTNIGGRNKTSTASATQSAPVPLNTQPCNNYVEFCNRKYSNITEVCAHNSPFTRPNNVARNQDYGVTQQLNDGIRMLQGQAHMVNGTLYYCHSSCDLLNAGTVEDYLREVTAWVEAHPFDVITIIFGNANWAEEDANGDRRVTAVDFASPIESSGLKNYIYQPAKTVMGIDDWPTLGEMIISQKRIVTFIDYNDDTANVPYMLWEFYNIWETPFSPTNFSFPCTLGRPEGISLDQQKNMLYMANHNLNAEIAIGGLSLLVPNVAQIKQTNAAEGEGSVGLMAQECAAQYDRPPNFLLVDFYNQGPTNGSVFEAAARANGVKYNHPCCGAGVRSDATQLLRPISPYFACIVVVLATLLTQKHYR